MGFIFPITQEYDNSSIPTAQVEKILLAASIAHSAMLAADEWEIPIRGRSSAGSAKHQVCHPGKVEEITKFVQDTENVISMQKQCKKRNLSSV